jgi:Peptidase family S51
MTKYILVGGYPHKASDGGKAFYSALAPGDGLNKVLVCLFSRPKDDWEKSFAQDKEWFTKNLPEKEIGMRLAGEENFLEEIAWADSIYFRGGETELLLHRLAVCPEWRTVLEDKIVAGSSAGAYMLAKNFYTITPPYEVQSGLGLVNANVVVHWQAGGEYAGAPWEQAEQALTVQFPEIPLYKLKEGEFVVL